MFCEGYSTLSVRSSEPQSRCLKQKFIKFNFYSSTLPHNPNPLFWWFFFFFFQSSDLFLVIVHIEIKKYTVYNLLNYLYILLILGLPRWSSGKESFCQCRRPRRHGLNHWVMQIPGSREWQPIPVFLPGKSYGQRNLVVYSPWGCKESGTTEHTCTHAPTHSSKRQSFCFVYWLFSNPVQGSTHTV